jgi:hypothetical protein
MKPPDRKTGTVIVCCPVSDIPQLWERCAAMVGGNRRNLEKWIGERTLSYVICFVQTVKSCGGGTPVSPHLYVRRTLIACLCSLFMQKNAGLYVLSPCNYSRIVLNHGGHIPREYLGCYMHQGLRVSITGFTSLFFSIANIFLLVLFWTHISCSVLCFPSLFLFFPLYLYSLYSAVTSFAPKCW